MRRTAFTLLAGALIALVAWWPLQGAATAVFWPTVCDGKGPDDIAIDALLAGQKLAYYSLVRHDPDIGPYEDDNCSFRFDMVTGRGNDLESGPMLLSAAIHHERNNLNALFVYRTAGEELRGLPNVMLGALQGCVEGSLLAGICRRYVAQRLTAGMITREREITAEADANDANAIKMACAALRGTHE